MNKVKVFNETDCCVKEIDDIPALIDFAINHEELDNLEFNVIFVDNAYIQELNRSYRGKDAPTDVITFALEDEKDFIKLDTRVLGDIYVSVDKAREQALYYGHSLKREISFLVIHGFLHLLGYDHMNKTDEEVMFKKQDDILNNYGIARV